MSRLIIYDTTNFTDFPIGGQLTSIRNFLRYMCERHPQRTSDILLVGTTVAGDSVGKIRTLEMFGQKIRFLPVAAAETDLANIRKSLRFQYVKGLVSYRKIIKINKKDCNYIHTPEAYGVVKLMCPRAVCLLFSHGSYFNMEKGFRFYRKNIVILKGFQIYLKWILRNAATIFLLDRDSEERYKKYNKNLQRVKNSVVCPDFFTNRGEREGIRFLFVGRLSRDKRVEPIIRAVMSMNGDCRLTIVGSGESYDELIGYRSDRVEFVGAVPPEAVSEYMQAADILVMNSVFEGIPMTILEALSYGLPVISTNVGGIGEVVRFGLDGEETDGTAEKIKEAAGRIIENYHSYSEHAFRRAKDFDYQTVNEEIYGTLCRFWGGNINRR